MLYKKLDKIETEVFSKDSNRFLQNTYRYLKILLVSGKKFHQDFCFERAAGLSYASIISLIPLAVLFFSLLALFGWGNEIAFFIENKIIPYIAPDFQVELKTILEEYLSPTAFEHTRTGIVNLAALSGLIFAALSIWVMTETVFNNIWKVPESRTYLQKMLTFWVLLTISPFLLLLSIYLGDVLGPESTLIGDAVFFKIMLTYFYQTVVPSLLGFAGFTILFLFVPATRVKINSAAFGALFSLILWEILRRSFYLYIIRAFRYTSFYKQLSTVPLILIWIYMIWLIILLGAQIAYVHQNYRFINKYYLQKKKKAVYSVIYLGLYVLINIYRSFINADRIPTIGEMAEKLGISHERLKNVAEILTSSNILTPMAAAEDSYTFSRTPDTLDMRQVVGNLLIKELPGEIIWKKDRVAVEGFWENSKLIEEAYNCFVDKFEGKKITDIEKEMAFV